MSKERPDFIQESIKGVESPRELIILIKNFLIILDDLRSGKYAQGALKADGGRLPVDPNKLLDYARENNIRGHEGLLKVLMGNSEVQKIMEKETADLVELTWQRFVDSKPSTEDIRLLLEQVPQFAERAKGLLM